MKTVLLKKIRGAYFIKHNPNKLTNHVFLKKDFSDTHTILRYLNPPCFFSNNEWVLLLLSMKRNIYIPWKFLYLMRDKRIQRENYKKFKTK